MRFMYTHNVAPRVTSGQEQDWLKDMVQWLLQELLDL
jgi:hypothetical protein